MKLDLQEALENLHYMREEDSEEGVANALFKVGMAYLQRGRTQEAAEPLDEAYYLCRKLENPVGLAQVCLARARLHQAEKDHAQAEQWSRQALEIWEGQGDQSGVLQALEALAQALDGLGQWPQAAASLERALLITQEAEDQVGQILMMQRLAPLYRSMERWGDALNAYLALGRMADAAGDRQRVALSLVGVGNMEAILEHKPQAALAFSQACGVFTELGQQTLAAQVRREAERLGLEPYMQNQSEGERS